MNKLDKEFIKWFGTDKYEELNLSIKLQKIADYACKEWLNLDFIPIIVEELPTEEDSRYFIKEEYIVVSNKYMTDFEGAVYSLLHEIEHYFQKIYLYVYNPKSFEVERRI